MTTPPRSLEINQPAARRFGRAAIGIGLGVLASAFVGALWLVFGLAAAAGDSGSFVPVSVAVFALYLAITIGLFAVRRNTAATFVAWLPAVLPIALSQLGAEIQLFQPSLSKSRVQGDATPSVNARLEILAEKTYDPVWIIKEDPHANTSKWSTIAWDKARADRCKTLLTTEVTAAPQQQEWFLFVNDATRRNKVPYNGEPICDPDAIWFEDYGSDLGRVVLTKFSAAGVFKYRISFQKPEEPRGFPGAIMAPTFSAREGYLYFDWWNTTQSGWNRQVVRSMQVRVKEPLVSSPANRPASKQEQK